FFAGERLRYYWFYHSLAGTVGRALRVDLLHAFQFVALASLCVIVLFAGLVGRKYFRSTAAGLLVGYLALVGLNPLGPAVAAAKHFARGVPILSRPQGTQTPVENVFVTDQLADEWMTHPLLSAAYVSGDWRHGQNVVWFLDVSSRAPALALIMVLMFLLLGARPKTGKGIAVAVTTALAVALNPVLGLAAAGSLAAMFLLFSLFRPRDSSGANGGASERGTAFFFALACSAGVLLAAPTFYHLFSNEGTAALSSPSHAAVKLAALAANFIVLVPLAVFGLLKASGEYKSRLWSMAAGGLMLLLAVPFIHLEEGNEHNLTNAAQVLLAVPALAWFGRFPTLKGGGRFKRSTLPLILFALFLPAAAVTLFSFSGRPGLPLGFSGRNLQRLPQDGPVAGLY
ncbi:MAG: hypothetical protein ACRD68_16280, partial [Pyrinomonadaceae bacterium]